MRTCVRSDRRRDVLAVVALVLFTVLVHWHAVTLHGAYYYFDIDLFHNPIRHVFARGFAQGRFTLWCSGIYAGFPLFADGQVGALYPFNFVGLPFLRTWQATNLIIVFHFALASIFMFVYLRSHVGPVAALVGSVCFAYSGPFSTHLLQPSLLLAASWIPLVFHVVDRAIWSGRTVWLVAVGPLLCVQLLAGFIQISAYTFMMTLIYIWLRASVGWLSWRARLRYMGLGCAAIVLAMGMAAVQLVPTFELTTESIRRRPMPQGFLAEGSTSAKMLATFIFPNLFGRLADGTNWSGEYNCYETIQYVGVAALLLVAVGLRRGAKRIAWPLAGIATISSILMLGKFSCAYPLLTRLPVLDRLRMLGRFNIFLAFALSALAALGMDWTAGGGRPSNRRVFGFAFAALVFAVLVGAHTYAGLFTLPANHTITAAATLRMGICADAARTFALLGAALITFALRARSHISVKTATLGIVLCVLVDLFGYQMGRHPTLPREECEKSPPSVEFLRAQRGPFRVLGEGIAVPPVRWLQGGETYRASVSLLPDDTALLWGIETAGGWSSLELRRWREFTRQMSEAKARLLNIHYLLKRGEAGETIISRVSGALPRCFIVASWDFAPSAHVALARVSEPSFNPLEAVVLEGKRDSRLPVSRADEGQGRASISLYTPEHVRIDVDAATQGLLVLCDTYYPGWKAYADGRTEVIWRADYLLRAVSVSAWRHHVDFVYKPVSFVLGTALSSTALIICAVLLGAALLQNAHVAPQRPSRRQMVPNNRVWLALLLTALALSVIARWPLWRQDAATVWVSQRGASGQR